MNLSKTLIATTLIATAFTGSAMAWGGDKDHRHSLADKLDHIVDLTDAQEDAIEKIEDKNRAALIAQYGEPEHKHDKKRKHGMKALLLLDPAHSDYVEQVEAKVTERAERMKAAAVSRANTMKEAYALLNTEQKQELAEKREKMKKKMEKRSQHRD